ncbi:metallophosphoesterase [Clostridium minihomine]|uniref:metallophosphoesterase n=1 Tax=Clostridium minihomine TaxID=2045012 RepID=UPI000C78D9BD|nr:metallophosphoesterase [Clostridium minihomine]
MPELVVSGENTFKKTIGNSIVFISDLHFDYTKQRYRPRTAPQMKDNFIAFIKENYANNILCLAGDFFNDYRKTLSFVKELESEQIVGFFVLGNHDFWNDGTRSHMEIINLFSVETQENQFFRFLTTGRKHYFNDICVIGDTGWTSFRRGRRRVSLKQFMGLPDAAKVKDFNPKTIISMHEKWISFANSILAKEEKVLILTHYPMVDFTREDKDCWWSSQTNLKGDNSWRIFGHTHKYKEQRNNNISSQRGYDNRANEDLQLIGINQYSQYNFGKLEKIVDQLSLVTTGNFEIISKFHSSIVVSNSGHELALVSTIKQRGYKRCAANKYNFAVLANSPEMYLERVKEVINGYLSNNYIGYILSDYISKDIIELIFTSIAFLESGNQRDIRKFIASAVITGYVFNGMPYLIKNMRLLDDYDILRFWLMFLTMKQYNLDVSSVDTVRKDNKSFITFCNVDIYFPSVNGMALTLDKIQDLLPQTLSLNQPVALLEESHT